MKKDYFNKYEFNNAVSLIDVDILEAKSQFEKYFKKYPLDYSGYPYYASCLTALGNFEGAKRILDKVESLYKKDQKYLQHKDRIKDLKKNIIYSRIKLLAAQKKYQELYNYYQTHYDYISELDIKKRIDIFCRKKLGKLGTFNQEELSYSFLQIINYNEELFLEHIKKHCSNNKYDPDYQKNLFYPDFPLNEVLEEIKKLISTAPKLYLGIIENTYYFRYDYCGKENNKTVNYIKVECFDDNIITMLPVSQGKYMPHIDLNYMNKELNNFDKTLKKENRIDRFNRRYKR